MAKLIFVIDDEKNIINSDLLGLCFNLCNLCVLLLVSRYYRLEVHDYITVLIVGVVLGIDFINKILDISIIIILIRYISFWRPYIF